MSQELIVAQAEKWLTQFDGQETFSRADMLNAFYQGTAVQQPAQAAADARDAERLDWLLGQHWVEPEVTFRLNLEDTDDFEKYKRDALSAIDAAIATHQQGGSK